MDSCVVPLGHKGSKRLDIHTHTPNVLKFPSRVVLVASAITYSVVYTRYQVPFFRPTVIRFDELEVEREGSRGRRE